MSVTQLVRTIGDRDNQFNRSALAGNAMLFNRQRWVRLTAGIDSIPQLWSNVELTYIVCYYTTESIDNTLRRSIIVSQDNLNLSTAPNLNASGREDSLQLYDKQISIVRTRTSSLVTGWFSPNTLQLQNRQRIDIVPLGAIDTDVSLVAQGRIQQLTNASFLAGNRNIINWIDIGRNNGLVVTDRSRFIGYIRSLEIVMRKLNAQEQRRVLNFGTANAAGLITSADISIDFNVINGQLPICRTGSRQLTVTAYNNTTPDTAGTTYANFYTL